MVGIAEGHEDIAAVGKEVDVGEVVGQLLEGALEFDVWFGTTMLGNGL